MNAIGFTPPNVHTTDRPGPYTTRQARGHRKTFVSSGDTSDILRSFDVTSATIVTGDTENHMPLTLFLPSYIAFTNEVLSLIHI